MVMCLTGATMVMADDTAKGGPTKAQQSLLQTMTTQFLLLGQNGSYDSQYSFLTPEMSDLISKDDFVTSQQAVEAQAGERITFNPIEVSWYPGDGLFGAVDFAGKSKTAPIVVCGYVVWRFWDENKVGLARFERNIVDLDIISEAAPEKQIELLHGFRCNPKVMQPILDLFN